MVVAAAVVALGLTLLAVQGVLAARRGYLPTSSAPVLDGRYGDGAPAVRLAVLGDSTAAGVGVDRAEDTVGGRLATLLAGDGRSVALAAFGVSGARTADLDEQVSRALAAPDRPDIALLLVGSNDATHAVRLSNVRRDLGSAVRRLRAAGVTVVVGTCPDLGAARAFAQPLRTVLAWEGRRVGAAEREAVRASGAVAVDLAAETGAAFRADPRTLSSDQFHPSARGYALWADALLPAVRAAIPR